VKSRVQYQLLKIDMHDTERNIERTANRIKIQKSSSS
jgi:hypothetical protein